MCGDGNTLTAETEQLYKVFAAVVGGEVEGKRHQQQVAVGSVADLVRQHARLALLGQSQLKTKGAHGLELFEVEHDHF